MLFGVATVAFGVAGVVLGVTVLRGDDVLAGAALTVPSTTSKTASATPTHEPAAATTTAAYDSTDRPATP